MVTVEDAIAFLNEINRLDPSVLPSLINRRVACNQAIADHPTVQVGLRDPDEQDGSKYEVGLLGILNGLFGVDLNGWGHICCVATEVDADGNIILDIEGA